MIRRAVLADTGTRDDTNIPLIRGHLQCML